MAESDQLYSVVALRWGKIPSAYWSLGRFDSRCRHFEEEKNLLSLTRVDQDSSEFGPYPSHNTGLLYPG